MPERIGSYTTVVSSYASSAGKIRSSNRIGSRTTLDLRHVGAADEIGSLRRIGKSNNCRLGCCSVCEEKIEIEDLRAITTKQLPTEKMSKISTNHAVE